MTLYSLMLDWAEDERRKGWKAGWEASWEKGRKKGLKNGLEKGKQEEHVSIIRNMVQRGADKEFICKVTGCSENELFLIKNS